MRKIFQTQRLETVEGVARLLNEHAIQTKITDGRSYKGTHRHDFSYSRPAPVQPAVWVIRADDLPHARKLLRDAGLLEPVHSASTYLPGPNRDPAPQAPTPGSKWAMRVRLMLLAGAAGLFALMMLGLVGG